MNRIVNKQVHKLLQRGFCCGKHWEAFIVSSAVGCACVTVTVVLRCQTDVAVLAGKCSMTFCLFVCFLKKGTQELLKYLRSKIQGMLLYCIAF